MTGFLVKRPHSPTPMRASRLWTWYPAVIMEDGFIMGQETGIRDGKPLHMAFGEKGGRCYYLGGEADWK